MSEDSSSGVAPDKPNVVTADPSATFPTVTIPTGAMSAGSAGFAVQQVQVWQGQFPPPDAIERYEAVSPGSFDRLVTMAERQQQAAIDSTAEARKFQRADNQRAITWALQSLCYLSVVRLYVLPSGKAGLPLHLLVCPS